MPNGKVSDTTFTEFKESTNTRFDSLEKADSRIENSVDNISKRLDRFLWIIIAVLLEIPLAVIVQLLIAK